MVPSPSLAFPPTAILTGVTASGKTQVALDFARAYGGGGRIEIINADSLLVYRGMDIGTAKPTKAELVEIPHHLIDVRDPNETFTAGDFVREVERAMTDIHARGKRALIVGGTGFYLKALLYGLWEAPAADPELRARLEKEMNPVLYERLLRADEAAALRIGGNDRYRLVRALETLELSGKTPSELERQQRTQKKAPHLALLITDRDTGELERRIDLRTQAMLEKGLLEEAKTLRDRFGAEARALGSVGYAESYAFLDGKKPHGRQVEPGLPGLVDEINLSTRQLVKRQRTWFKGQFAARGDAEIFVLDAEREKLNARLEAIYAKEAAPFPSG